MAKEADVPTEWRTEDDYEAQMETDWSNVDGSPPNWWNAEFLDDGEVVLALNGKRSFFEDDSEEDLATRLWGATLYARELRFTGPERFIATPRCEKDLQRALYGYCCENACALRHVLDSRGFDTRCIAVMTKGDIRQCLGGERPESVTNTSYRHYLVQVKDPAEDLGWITCDVSQYRYDTYDSAPYVRPELPDEYVWFEDSVELGEKVLSDRDPDYCIGEEPDYK